MVHSKQVRTARRFGAILAGVLLLASLFGSGTAHAKSPQKIIERYAKQAVTLLQDTSLRPNGNLDPLIGKISEELDPIISYREMAVRTLGPKARELSDEKIDRFTAVFRPFVKRIYVGQMASYLFEGSNPWTIDAIEVVGHEIRYERYALVRTVIHVRKGDTQRDFDMHFKLVRRGGQWGVYDFTFEDFSLVENYRSQFSSLLANSSIDELIKTLEEKLRQLREGEASAASDTVVRAPETDA